MTQTIPTIMSTQENTIVTMTPKAIAKVQEIVAQQHKESTSTANLGLRVFVAGGGCSGLQYGMTLDSPQESDTCIQLRDITVLLDEMSIGYLSGSQIDYVDSLMGAGFQVNNPNAVSSCGCGHSFKTSATGTDTPQAASCGCGH
jgi:iron-sulfur cluster assembly protein